MDTHSDAGACGVKMLAPDGHFLPESKRGYPSPLTSFWKLTGMHRCFPNNPRFDRYYLSRLDENSIHSVPVLAGAYMMLRKKALDRSGLLDEDFFMYGEDTDLNRRIYERYRTMYYPKVTIVHNHAKGSHRNLRLFWIHVKAAIYYLNKWGWIFDKERANINRMTQEIYRKK